MIELDYEEVKPFRKYSAKLDADKADQACEHLYSNKEKNEAKSLLQVLENTLNPIAKKSNFKIQYWIKRNSSNFQGVKVKSALTLENIRPQELSSLVEKYEKLGMWISYHPKSLTMIFHIPRGWYRK